MRRKLEKWPDAVLEASLRRVGPLAPRLKYRGQVIDGKRRFLLCERLGIEILTLEAETESEAAAALYALEPHRAVEMFGKGGIVSFSLLLGVSPGQVAIHFPRRAPPVRNINTRRMRKLEVYLEQCEQGLATPSVDHLRKLLSDDRT